MAGESDRSARIEVVYALPDKQDFVSLPYEPGLTAGQAVERSGLLDRYPETRERPLVLGVFGKEVEAAYLVEPGDRVEICRPLRRDPREMRKELWSEGKVIGGGSISKPKPE